MSSATDEPQVEGSLFDPTDQANWVKHHQGLLKEKASLVNALVGDLGKKGAAIPDTVIVQQRIEHLVNQLFPPFADGEQPVGPEEPPSQPDRLVFELRWLERMEEILKVANRQAIMQGASGLQVAQGFEVKKR